MHIVRVNLPRLESHGRLTRIRVSLRNLSQVSWIRKRDLHILTSMSVTYTSDARFTIVGNPENDDWNLRIDYVQPRDAGIYECQVNTEPKIYRAVALKVLGEFLSLSDPGIPETGCLHSFAAENALFGTRRDRTGRNGAGRYGTGRDET